ncbi:glycoside hydrolase family 15 protein [Spongiactinospora sp. TRM90649]|uniref:glycoside hydrolase family 15 protein n=1 Tax=Spongiactinospora sp. TRM90649 TaxID=3031114 RepID=UPI0023F7FB68|nr:glycoside hydrolase family 15 protein [Spongiactinospora sp. TRM90649]MDF5752434.1 glycoside hydrolase family 15 protein [Spongiactinospora sp. TRM90649]
MSHAALVRRSIDLIARHQSPSGAYPASPTFSAYRGYCWLRDGSFIAEGVSRHGQARAAGAFHAWCAHVIASHEGRVDALVERAGRGEAIPPGDMLPTRFTLDGAEGSDEWWDFQLDGYGTWLWALAAHTARHGEAVPGADRAIRVAARYLTAFWDTPCYDWWEEHVEQRHVSTLGSLHAGLRAAVDSGALSPAEAEAARGAVRGIGELVRAEGTTGGHLAKWLGSGAVDASLLACVEPFGMVPPDDPLGAATVAAVEESLSEDRGVYRYAADTFYGGGRWPLLTGFLGWNHAAAGRAAEAARCLDWIAAQATPDGELPEQVTDLPLAPGMIAEWEERWGPVGTPLLWSHGMYLILAAELGVRG